MGREQLQFSPLLLPPKNFRGERILELLDSFHSETLPSQIRSFKKDFFAKGKLAYNARKNRLLFKPTELGNDHGRPGPQERADLALSRHHRLGCRYNEQLHYDVTRSDERDFDGSIEFTCRSGGLLRPRGRHVNVLVDDCIR